MSLVVAVVLAVVLLASLVTWQASRLDRLHSRVEAAEASLDAALVRRAWAAEAFATSVAAVVPDEAAAVRAAAVAARGRERDGREDAENDVSRAVLRLVDALARAGTTLSADDRAELAAAASRAALARRFHNDAVRDLRQRRRAPLPRLLRLGGRRPLPVSFELDEDALLRPVD